MFFRIFFHRDPGTARPSNYRHLHDVLLSHQVANRFRQLLLSFGLLLDETRQGFLLELVEVGELFVLASYSDRPRRRS